MDKTEILYDHYKDTFEIIRKYELLRNKLSILCIVILAILYIVSIEPNQSIATISSIIKSKLDADIIISFSSIQSLIWVCFLFLLIRYYHLCVTIERRYPYLHKLEEELQDLVSENFTREGKSYNNNYPLLMKFIHFFYNTLYTILITVLIILKIGSEMRDGFSNFGFDFLVALFASIVTLIYEITKLTMQYKENKKH